MLAIITHKMIIHSTGSFQGPVLTIAFEGAPLSTEEVCLLLTNVPAKLHDNFVSMVLVFENGITVLDDIH